MTGKTHLVLGASVGAVVGYEAHNLIPFGLAVVGSILPDIDIDRSTINGKIRQLTGFTPWTHFMRHRGLAHRWYVGVALALLLYLGLTIFLVAHGFQLGDALSAFCAGGFLAGFLSHLLLDMPRRPGLVLEWGTRIGAVGLVAEFFWNAPRP